MHTIGYKGKEIYDLANRISPICRSITGKGVRDTFDVIQEYIGQDGASRQGNG